MPLTDYLSGLVWFGLGMGALATATTLVTRRRLAGLPGEARALAIFLVATTVLFLMYVIPLALGVLTRATPVVTGLLLCLAVWALLPHAPAEAAVDVPPAPRSGAASWVVASVAVAAAAIALLAYTAAVALLPFGQVDVVNFHLPIVARWIQTGSLWQIDQFLVYQAQGNYPHTGDLAHLAAVLPWRDEFAVRYVALPFVAATGVAVHALARELGAPAASSMTYGAVVVTLPTVIVSNLDFELTDAIMYATFATGALFLARHVRSRGRTDLVLAGLGLGLAFGVKWYAVSAVGVAVLVWIVGLVLARRPWRRVLWDAARLTAIVAALGGIWLVRNWVESGNPVFPVRVRVFGTTVFDAPFDVFRHLAGFSLFDYADSPSILRRYAWPAFNHTLGLAWLVLVGGCLLAVGRSVGRAWRRVDRRVAGVVVCAVLIAIAYAATPYSALGGKGVPAQIDANTRYVVPALLLAAAATAWAAGRLGRAGILIDLLGLAAVVDGIRRAHGPIEAKHVAAAVLALGVGTVVIWWLRNRTGRRTHGRRLVHATAAAAVVAALAAGGYAAQRRFAEHRYVAVEAPLAWTSDHRHRRIGLAGLWDINGLSPVFPAFGPRLGNRVGFVGPFRRGLLSQYTTREPFVAALRRGRYDLVVVGLATQPIGRPAQELAWARSAGYREVARSGRLVLLSAPPPPSGA